MAKGKSYEREISKDMSLWLTNGEDQDCIWYTKSSGGRATRRIHTKQVASKYDHGDLGPDGSKLEWWFNLFSIELKTGYGTKNKKSTTLWAILDLIDSSQQNPKFYDFWYQAVNDADLSNREPLLVFRRNRRLSCIAMRQYIFDAFIYICKSPVEFDTISVQFNGELTPIVVCNLAYFYDYTWNHMHSQTVQFNMTRAIMKNKRN